MKIVKNFLNETLINDIENYIQTCDKKQCWHSNSTWNKNIVKNSGLVTILPISNFSEQLINSFISYDKKFEEYFFCFQYYEWHRGSYIPWHNDHCYDFGATIYLNKEWDVEDGGIFFYTETDDVSDLKCVYPKYNTLVLNDSKELHHVSLVNYHSKVERKTIQIWISKNKSKSKSKSKNTINYQ